MIGKDKYQIKVHSCKKDTLITYYLSDAEAKLLQEIATATQLSSKSEWRTDSVCHPSWKINGQNKGGINV